MHTVCIPGTCGGWKRSDPGNEIGDAVSHREVLGTEPAPLEEQQMLLPNSKALAFFYFMRSGVQIIMY